MIFTIIQCLKYLSFSSLFSLLRKAGIKNVLKIDRVEKICFRSGLCTSLHEDLQKRINNMSPLTVLAPTNTQILRMSKTQLERLQEDRESLITWLKQYIFIGQLAESTAEHEELIVSADSSHSVATRVRGLVGRMVGDSSKINVLNRVLDVKKGPIKFREGVVYVVEENDSEV